MVSAQQRRWGRDGLTQPVHLPSLNVTTNCSPTFSTLRPLLNSLPKSELPLLLLLAACSDKPLCQNDSNNKEQLLSSSVSDHALAKGIAHRRGCQRAPREEVGTPDRLACISIKMILSIYHVTADLHIYAITRRAVCEQASDSLKGHCPKPLLSDGFTHRCAWGAQPPTATTCVNIWPRVYKVIGKPR